MKIRYNQWTRDREISVNSLRFDPMNPRLVGVGKGDKSVIATLAEEEDIADLLRRIIRYGLAPIERLVVIYEEDKPIVIEGNRRLAVYKMLSDPEKAPKGLAGLVKTARNELGVQDIPRKLGCDIPRDAAEAQVYAYMKHAEDKHFKPWAKIQQAVVDVEYAAAKERGEAVPVDLSDANIRDARAMVQFYKLAGILSRDPESGIKSSVLRNFPYDAVKRTFLAKVSESKIGVKANLSGVEIRGAVGEFTEFFRKTLAKMGEGKATRFFNTVDDFTKWVDAVGYIPSGAKKLRLSDHIEHLDAGEPEPEPEPKDRTGKKKAAKVARRPSKVFPEGLKLEYHAPRLEGLLEEVEKLNVARQKNVSGIMLRCVLELSVDGALHERGIFQDYMQSLKGNKDMLSVRIQWLRDSSGITFEREVKKSLNGLIGGKDKLSILDSLNSWVHSRWSRPSGDDVRDRALELTPLLQLLLSKP